MSRASFSKKKTLIGLVMAIAVLNLPQVLLASKTVYPMSPPVNSVTVGTNGNGSYVTVDGKDYVQLEDTGRPVLPYRIVNVLLPQGEEVDKYWFPWAAKTVLTTGFSPARAPALVSTEGITAENDPVAIWSPDSDIFPSSAGRYLGTGYLHGYAIASFAVFPFAVEDDKLILLEDLTLEFTTRAATGRGIIKRERFREGFQAEVQRDLASMVINPGISTGYYFGEVKVDKKPGGFQPTSFPSLEGSPVDYVIITNDSLAAAYQTLADWKTSKGVPTVIRTTEWIEANYRNGSDMQETIRTFIQDAYAKWGVTYVLLGGDTEQVPVRMAFSCFYGDDGYAVPVDLYYACLDGDWNANHNNVFGEMPSVTCSGDDEVDLYAEVYTGRLTTRNTQDVDLLTSKIISYESPNISDYTNRILMLAEVLFPVGWTEGETINLNGADLAQYVYLTKMTDPGLDVVRLYETEELYPGSIAENHATVMDSLNAGFDHVIHVGHGFRFNMSVGDRSIMNSDADVLTNTDRYSNFYMLNCTGAAFTYFCLAEHLLLSPNGGGVSAIGASQSAFPNAASYYMYEYYDLLFLQDRVHLGEVFARSRLPRTPYAELGDNVDLWTHYIYALMGEPEMPVWTSEIDTLAVSHVSNVGLGTSSIGVTVNSGGSPLDQALVCLSKGDDDYQYGYTNGSGLVTFDFRAESAGEIRVVVTANNHERYDESITVDGTSGAYVSLSGMTVDDDNTGGTWGNGDGVIDGGEMVALTMEMVNSGGSASGNVTVKLRSDNPSVTITDSTAAVGVVSGNGGTQVASDPVNVYFSPGFSDEASVEFDLVVEEDAVETWDDMFRKVVHAPVLDLVSLRIDDTATGNGDGVVDAGEAFLLYYGLKNFGTGAAYGLTAELSDLDGASVFTDSTDGYADLGAMESGENIAGFALSEPDVSTGHNLEITIMDAWGRTYRDTLELRPPVPPSNLTFDPSFGSDRLAVEWTQSISGDAYKYDVYRSDGPGGPYDRVNVDAVYHGVYLDVGLEASTRYYYVITAIDSSGNKSSQSSEFSGTTNPDQMEGWPIQMSDVTTSSTVIGDIDGDGYMDIVQGNTQVYAWHHNGVEMIDGDNDAQTWGILNTEGNGFISPIALARIDGVPGLDIIAGSRNTKEVYVFDYQGNTLTGWPQPVEYFIRAGLVAGDINDDDVYEIIAVDEYGVLYVWNPDGTEYRDGDSNPSTPGVFYRLPGCTFLYSTPAIADIDDDGINEIVSCTQAGQLYVFNEDGTIVTGFPVTESYGMYSSPAVGDIDDNGDLEIVVLISNGDLKVYNHDGTLLWGSWYKNSQFFQPSPALGDLTGDGKLEIVLPSSNGYLYVIRSNATHLPGWPVEYSEVTYTESSPIVIDIDGDGNLDVILGDETQLVKAWDAGGNLVDGFPLSIADATRATPAADDLDNDGDVELVLAGWDQHVYVWDFPGSYTPDPNEWRSFHANCQNDGLYGSVLATGIEGVAFSVDVGSRGVSLKWNLPPSAAIGLFDVSRAPVIDGTPGEFGIVAAGRAAGPDGAVAYIDESARVGLHYVYRLEAAQSGEVVHMTGTVYVPVREGALSQNYPNPFNPVTSIEYCVPDGGARRVSLIVYDVSGARVRVLVDADVGGGRYTAKWDGRNDKGARVGSGVYFYRLVSKEFSKTKKMLLLK